MSLTWQQWAALTPILFVSGAIVAVMLAIAIKRHHFWNATVGVFGLNLAWISVAVLFFGPLLMAEQFPVMLPRRVAPRLVVPLCHERMCRQAR